MMKYLAAARSGKNVAAQGGANVVGSVSRSGVGRNPLSAASGAGYDGGKSTYIRMNGSGYKPGAGPKSSPSRQAPPGFFKPDLPPVQRITNMTKRQLTVDEQLSSLL